MRIEMVEMGAALPEHMAALLARIGDASLRGEGLAGRYQVTLLVTDDTGIQQTNRQQRGLDRPTDVLSFPSVQYPHGTARDHPARLRRELDVETGCMHLGDIMLSVSRTQAQAQEYGHAFSREAGFLFAHGMLHLLGYDHETEMERAQMRVMEEKIMNETGTSRDLCETDYILLEGAREAMKKAYTPYSHYNVGACIRTRDGRLYKGCNVENASYGLAICAERNAMTTAVTEGGQDIEAIAICGEGSMPYPCGACRQFLREFVPLGSDIRVIVANENNTDVTTLAALLPKSFGPESLQEVKK